MSARAYVLVFLISPLPKLGCGFESEHGEHGDDLSETGGDAGEPGCDPLAQDCADGMGCHVASGDSLFECQVSPWSYAEGEPCELAYDCAAGLYCAPAELLPSCMAISCCTSYCDLDDPQACAGTNTGCVPFFNSDPPPLLEAVGVCANPN